MTVDELYLLIRALAQAPATQLPTDRTLDRAIDIVLVGIGAATPSAPT
jgi:hypothetical protein